MRTRLLSGLRLLLPITSFVFICLFGFLALPRPGRVEQGTGGGGTYSTDSRFLFPTLEGAVGLGLPEAPSPSGQPPVWVLVCSGTCSFWCFRGPAWAPQLVWYPSLRSGAHVSEHRVRACQCCCKIRPVAGLSSSAGISHGISKQEIQDFRISCLKLYCIFK